MNPQFHYYELKYVYITRYLITYEKVKHKIQRGLAVDRYLLKMYLEFIIFDKE